MLQNHEGYMDYLQLFPGEEKDLRAHHIISITAVNCDDGFQCGINTKHKTAKSMLYTIQTIGRNKTNIHKGPDKDASTRMR